MSPDGSSTLPPVELAAKTDVAGFVGIHPLEDGGTADGDIIPVSSPSIGAKDPWPQPRPESVAGVVLLLLAMGTGGGGPIVSWLLLCCCTTKPPVPSNSSSPMGARGPWPALGWAEEARLLPEYGAGWGEPKAP